MFEAYKNGSRLLHDASDDPSMGHDAFFAVLSKVDDFATFKKVEVHAKNSTF